MNRELVGATLGALVLAISGCAVIDDRSDLYPVQRFYSREGVHWGSHSHEYRNYDWHRRPADYLRLEPDRGTHARDYSSGRAYGYDGVKH